MKMTQIPITLRGKNLGERHRVLNSLVADAYNVGEPFENIIPLPELSAVDRLFKIDLASKHKHVDFILKNLQDEDMLYVSRALKSKWLLDEEYRTIVNPANLEDVLYPNMITTAVNKMKHWIHLNLRDSIRCLEFYEYYSEKDDDYAFKFLCKCPEATILNEFLKQKTLHKITPHRFKILCERTPSVATMFFEILLTDKSLLKKYLAKKYKYFECLKCVLKNDADTFLNITEQRFEPRFKRLSAMATKFILRQKRDRFMQKPELYTARILNVETIAQCLTQNECEELIIKLARARFLERDRPWFNYKNVEPLVKRIDVEKRGDLKKKIFIDKDFGEIVTDWPYSQPTTLEHLLDNNAIDVFIDKEDSPGLYDHIGEYLRKRCHRRLLCSAPRMDSASCALPKPKTVLDSLFEEYRVTSFDKTLFELRKKISSESSSQNRMFMMLVLVSKSGGKTECLDALLQLLMEHRNEPSQVRAAIIRSLVKRASVWRVPEDIWKNLLIFGQGLGLDGNDAEADCDEGLHAVVIRSILSNHDCESGIKTAFMKKFSPLTSYSLSVTEKQRIKGILLNILLESANTEVNVKTVAQTLEYALNTLQAYNVKFETHPEVITSIKNLVKKDPTGAKGILKRLFRSKLGRREFFTENFNLIQTDASYVNALKHDIAILSVDTFLKAIVSNKLNAEQFLRKMSIYFSETEGLSGQFLNAIKGEQINKRLARPLAYLIGHDLKSYILDLDTKGMEIKRFSAMVRANAHVSRPAFNIDSLEWRKAGVKLIANKVVKCKAVDIDHLIKQLLTWKRTARLAVILAQRTGYERDVFAVVAKIRPTIALKTALAYFRRQGDFHDLRIWELVKPLIMELKVSIKNSRPLLRNVRNIESIPLKMRAEYASEVYKVINEIDFNKSMIVLYHINLLLPQIKEDFLDGVLYDYIHNIIFSENKNDNYNDTIAKLFLRILGKYLVLCKTEETQNRRFNMFGQVYLERLQAYWVTNNKKKGITSFLTFLQSFKYTEAFLSNEYVSCIPVMEKVIKWMQNTLPMEKYFKYYVPLHLTMLYYKSIRQVAQQMPDMLADEEKRCKEGYKVVGEIFGKYVGQEAHVLSKNYFESIVVLYGDCLQDYISSFNQGRFRMLPFIIRGIVEVSDGFECNLGLDLYNQNLAYFNDREKEEIVKCLEQNNQIEMQFFYNTKLDKSNPIQLRPFTANSGSKYKEELNKILGCGSRFRPMK